MSVPQRIAFWTILRREITRFLRIWTQTLLPSVISITLYFVIFGSLIGSRISPFQNYSYIQYITPGLIMMAVITNSYSNVAGSFFSMRFQNSIEEILVSPVSPVVILLGFCLGGIIRGLLVSILVTFIASLYTSLTIHHGLILCAMVALTSTAFSLAGFLNAIYAKRFDDVAFVPTFILTPLIYLGGVFYPLSLLSPFWQKISMLNPILYMVNTFRYGMLGESDVPISIAFLIVIAAIGGLFVFNLHYLKNTDRIRSSG